MPSAEPSSTTHTVGSRRRISSTSGLIVAASFKHGMTTAARLHHAADAQRIITLHTTGLAWERDSGVSIDKFCREINAAPTAPNMLPLFSAHQMGTCRLGSNDASAVCNGDGEVFGLPGAYVADASLFPASSGVNPMVTIMALALHVAKGMKH